MLINRSRGNCIHNWSETLLTIVTQTGIEFISFIAETLTSSVSGSVFMLSFDISIPGLERSM